MVKSQCLNLAINMRTEQLHCLAVYNTRPQNTTDYPYHNFVDDPNNSFGVYQETRGLNFLEIPPPEISKDMLLIVRIRGGDGTTREVLNWAGQGEILDRLVIWHEAGGSANTLLKGISHDESSNVPGNLREVFKTPTFDARFYHPLEKSQEGEVFYGAYLGGFGHLSISSTQWREHLSSKNPKINIHDLYKTAGLRSLLSLAAKKGEATQPEKILFRNNQTEETIEGNMAACEVVTIPRLGTFHFKNPVPHNKIRLLTLTSENKAGIILKYGLTLAVGLLFSPDTAIRIGLVKSRDDDEVTVFLRPKSSEEINACYDGDLYHQESEVTLKRSSQGVVFVLPKILVDNLKD